MKTFIELEEIGIVGTYLNNNQLHIITKDSSVWAYNAGDKSFYLVDQLM